MSVDRKTTIDGDQITDGTVGFDELNTEEVGENRRNWMLLTFKSDENGQMKWAYSFGNKILR
jgi:hypothetical protein